MLIIVCLLKPVEEIFRTEEKPDLIPGELIFILSTILSEQPTYFMFRISMYHTFI